MVTDDWEATADAPLLSHAVVARTPPAPFLLLADCSVSAVSLPTQASSFLHTQKST